MSEAKVAKPTFKMNTSARMRIGEIEAVEPPPPPEGEVPLIDGRDGWWLLDNAPRDGSIVHLKADDKASDKTAVLAMWRATRMYDTEIKRWVNVGFWVDPMTRLQIPFEPFVWRHTRGSSTPGMVL